MDKYLTALEVINDKMNVSINVAKKVDNGSYHEGKATAYNDSYRIMKKELERLRNLWQNDCLTYDSFNLPS